MSPVKLPRRAEGCLPPHFLGSNEVRSDKWEPAVWPSTKMAQWGAEGGKQGGGASPTHTVCPPAPLPPARKGRATLLPEGPAFQ